MPPCRPGHNPTAVPLSLTDSNTHTHTHRIFTVSTRLTSQWTQRGDSSQAMHYTHPGPPPHKHTHTLIKHGLARMVERSSTHNKHRHNSLSTLTPLKLAGDMQLMTKHTRSSTQMCVCAAEREILPPLSVLLRAPSLWGHSSHLCGWRRNNGSETTDQPHLLRWTQKNDKYASMWNKLASGPDLGTRPETLWETPSLSAT